MTQFDVTPWAPPSRATTLDRPSSPCFAVTYADLKGLARRPCTLETLTTRPQPCAYMCGSDCLMSRNGAVEHQGEDEVEAFEREVLERG